MSNGHFVLNYFILGPRRGVPNELIRSNDQAVRVEPQLVPEPRDAIQHFESLGGHLTLFSPFGEDPLKDRGDLISERQSFPGNTLTLDHFFTVSLTVTLPCLEVVFCI